MRTNTDTHSIQLSMGIAREAAATKCTFTFSTSRFSRWKFSKRENGEKKTKRRTQTTPIRTSPSNGQNAKKKVKHFPEITSSTAFLIIRLCVCASDSFFPCVWPRVLCKGETASERGWAWIAAGFCIECIIIIIMCAARIKSFPIQANGCAKRGSAFPHQKTHISMHTRLYLCVRLVLHQVPGYTNTLVQSAHAVDVYNRERPYFVFAHIFREADGIC